MMEKTYELLRKERRRVPALSAAFLIAALSGFLTYLFAGHGVWQQWTYLLHSFAGLVLTIVLVPYLVTHFRRTLGLRRPTVLIAGLLAAAIFLVLAGTGLYLALFGQRESLRWLYSLHVVMAFVVVVVVAAHIVGHRLLLPERRREMETFQFPSITRAVFKVSAATLITAITFVVSASLIYHALPTTYRDEAVIQPYEMSYGTHPFRPSQTETVTGGFVDVRRIAGSEQCGSCHAQIVKEWQGSIHSQAASDKAYQTNVNLLSQKKSMAATRYCEGCHAPVALLSGQLTKGGKLDTHGHMKEGVSCMTCHGIDQIVHLKGVASYRFAGKQDYLFADRNGWMFTKVHNYLVRIQPRQHRRDMGRDLSRTPQLCATCHAQFMDKDVNNWGWVKMQDDYSAWLNGPYSRQSEQTYAHAQITRCQDCHMPLAASRDPSADTSGLARSHRFLGGNTAIPYITGDHEHLALVKEFLQTNKVRVDIDEPNRPGARRSVKPVDQKVTPESQAPVYFYLGETVTLNIAVTNYGVGHDFPGGTIDINEAWLELRVTDAQDKTVFWSGALNKDNDLDPKAHIYQSIPIDRNGKHVWRHDLFNMIGDSYKKVIPAGRSDFVQYRFQIPAWVKSPLTATAVVRYRKLNNRYARWALKDPGLKLPIVDMARDTLTLPVRHKREVETGRVSMSAAYVDTPVKTPQVFMEIHQPDIYRR